MAPKMFAEVNRYKVTMTASAGSIVEIRELGRIAVIIAGPFDSARGSEFVIAPIYERASDPSFAWTDSDFRLHPSESSLDREAFAGLWNARPAMADSIGRVIGSVLPRVAGQLAKTYWAALADDVPPDPARLGRSVRVWNPWHRDTIRFQETELMRWQPVTARVFPAEAVASRTITASRPDFGHINVIRISVGGVELEYSGEQIAEAKAALCRREIDQSDILGFLDRYVQRPSPQSTYDAVRAGQRDRGMRGRMREFAANPFIPAVWRVNEPEDASKDGSAGKVCFG